MLRHAAVGSLLIVLVPAIASAQHASAPASVPQHRLTWQYARFSTAEYVFGSTVAATYLVLEFGLDTPSSPNWTGPILFDEAVRSELKGSSATTRNQAANWSGYLTLVPQGMALADSLVVPLAFDRWNTDVAWQMTAINLQSMALSGLLSRAGHRFIARQRPDIEPCMEDPNYASRCFRGPNASFPSGHAAAAFTGAGLTCAHHLNLPLFGHRIADVTTCIAATTIATGSSVLRMVADRHYFSDMIAGTAIGVGSGFVLPMLAHYRRPVPGSKQASVRWTVAPMPHTPGQGLSIYGWF